MNAADLTTLRAVLQVADFDSRTILVRAGSLGEFKLDVPPHIMVDLWADLSASLAVINPVDEPPELDIVAQLNISSSNPDQFKVVGGFVVECSLVAPQAATQQLSVEKALELARRYGGIDGAHHKAWVIDQMVRALTGERYEAWIAEYRTGENETYTWDEGTPP